MFYINLKLKNIILLSRMTLVAPISAKPTIIFRLEMAQPLYVITLVACSASSRVFAAKYRHRSVYAIIPYYRLFPLKAWVCLTCYTYYIYSSFFKKVSRYYEIETGMLRKL